MEILWAGVLNTRIIPKDYILTANICWVSTLDRGNNQATASWIIIPLVLENKSSEIERLWSGWEAARKQRQSVCGRRNRREN